MKKVHTGPAVCRTHASGSKVAPVIFDYLVIVVGVCANVACFSLFIFEALCLSCLVKRERLVLLEVVLKGTFKVMWTYERPLKP